MMNKTKYIILLIVLLLVGGAAWYLLANKIISPNIFNPGAQNIDNSVSGPKLNFVAGLSAVDQQTLTQSDAFATLLKMQGACQSLKDQNQQKECEKNFELSQVLALKKLELCSLLAKQDECYLSFAVTAKDSSLCQKINNAEQKASCNFTLNVSQANFSGQSLEECRPITETNLKNICISKYISLQTDVKICTDALIVSISANSQKRCEDAIWFNQAITQSKQQFCSNISDERTKQTCQAYFSPST